MRSIFLEVLSLAQRDGLWERVSRWHHVDFGQVEKELDKLENMEQQAAHLKCHYPSLYTFVLFEKKEISEVHQFMEENLKYLENPEEYTRYVHGNLLP